MPPRWSNLGKRLYQVKLCSSLTRQPIFIALARPEAPNSPNHWTPPPNSPKESESSTILAITYQGHLFILSTKLHPDSYTPSVFPRFPLQIPTMSKDLVGIWNKSSETWIPSKNQISLRSDHLFVRNKYSNFHVFQEFRFPPPTPPNVKGSGRNLKLEL